MHLLRFSCRLLRFSRPRGAHEVSEDNTLEQLRAHDAEARHVEVGTAAVECRGALETKQQIEGRDALQTGRGLWRVF